MALAEIEQFFEALDEITLWGNCLKFAKESNMIEGITSEKAHDVHANALSVFLKHPLVTVKRLEKFVEKIEPKAFLRTEPKHKVFIAGREAPFLSGTELKEVLILINDNDIHPWVAHNEYE